MMEREAPQYDVRFDSQRFASVIAQGVSDQMLEEQKTYIRRQLKTDIGERLDRAESHYVYEIREGRLYGEGESEPFLDVIGRGVMQRSSGTRENAELTGFQFVESYLGNPETPDGATVFNPSPPGHGYMKNYLDVHRKVGKEVHSVRYFSTISNREYGQKIIAINPSYKEVLSDSPQDIDFFLNPVVVPRHLNFPPDELAMFILGKREGIDENELERVLTETASIWTSYVNYLAENPENVFILDQKYRAGLAATKRAVEGQYIPTYNIPRLEIQYLASQKETLGGGGCGAGACSVGESGEKDDFGAREFSCPECGKKNKRPFNQFVSNCQKCGSDKVLPDTLKGMTFPPGLSKVQ